MSQNSLNKRRQKLEERALMKKAQLGILPEPEVDTSKPLLDDLAAVEHSQWVEWARALMESEPGLSKERKERWQRFFVEYEQLPEEVKELDRKWAKRALEVIQRRLS